MKVIKIGGGCLHGKKTVSEIVDLLCGRGKGKIIAVPVLNGITDLLIEGMQAVLSSDTSRPFEKPASGRISFKVITHPGDEVVKVFRVE